MVIEFSYIIFRNSRLGRLLMAKVEGHKTKILHFQIGNSKYTMDFSAVVLYRAISKQNLPVQCSLQQP
jgi:hypothetical protein